jgi:hypothetical protein
VVGFAKGAPGAQTTPQDSANNPTLNTTIYILFAGYVDIVR